MGYAKEIYSQARQILDERRQKAQMRAEQRRTELYRELPRLSEIERMLARTGIAAAQAALAGGGAQEQIERLKQQNLALQKERAQILRDAGLPEDFLAVHYVCPDCGDTGYVGQDRCACLAKLLRQLAYGKLSDTVSGASDCRFENFSLSYYPDEPSGPYGIVPRRAMDKVLNACRAYARNFTPRSDSLLLCGGTGLGKTHLSLAIAGEVTNRGFGVVYTSSQRLLDRLSQQQFSRDITEDYQQMALSCDLLIIDDLGAEFSTAFTVAALYNLINSRIIENRPCVISTNLDENGLRERYGDRILSRLLCAYRPLQFYGEDIRMIKRFACAK
ncbi:ATP-binding protein [Anaerotruncus rubiinfantis]|jgi:DNA replication protein DnaC|uniref:ATP-binding protein n=1 Tax=Anaerotruncus rubiinfantis TaxID=1720200 RepID=UPI00082CD766|nr:ATP-binding protein [Anaerotruncus rubiinfantis]